MDDADLLAPAEQFVHPHRLVQLERHVVARTELADLLVLLGGFGSLASRVDDLTEGTANMGGLMDVDSQFRLQEWGQSIARQVPDFAMSLLPVAAVLLGVWLSTRRKSERKRA